MKRWFQKLHADVLKRDVNRSFYINFLGIKKGNVGLEIFVCEIALLNKNVILSLIVVLQMKFITSCNKSLLNKKNYNTLIFIKFVLMNDYGKILLINT